MGYASQTERAMSEEGRECALEIIRLNKDHIPDLKDKICVFCGKTINLSYYGWDRYGMERPGTYRCLDYEGCIR